MPWANPNWYPYIRQSVNANAPAASGVYAIAITDKVIKEWIYIGESQDIRERLLQHLGGDNPCISQSGANVFSFELVNAPQRVARQYALIAELGRTRCNHKLG